MRTRYVAALALGCLCASYAFDRADPLPSTPAESHWATYTQLDVKPAHQCDTDTDCEERFPDGDDYCVEGTSAESGCMDDSYDLCGRAMSCRPGTDGWR